MIGKISQWLILAFIVIVTAFLLQPVQKKLAFFLETAESGIIDTLEEQLGRKITYKSISPSIFRFFQIKGLVIHDKGAALLSANKVRIYYRLSSLIKGDFENAVYRISLQNSNLVIQQNRDDDVLELIKNLIYRQAGLPTIDITGRNIGIRVKTDNFLLDMDKVFLSYKPGLEGISIQIKGAVGYSPYGLLANLQIVGKIDPSFAWSDFRVKVKTLKSDFIEVNKLTFQVSSRESIVAVRKIQDKSPFDLLLTYMADEKKLQIDAASENFIPSDYIAVGELMPNFKPWLDSNITLSGSMIYDIQEGTIDYNGAVDADIYHPRIPVPVQLSSSFEGDQNTLSIVSLAVQSEYGSGSYTGQIDLNSYHPDGRLVLSRVRLPGGDVIDGNFNLIDQQESLLITSSGITLSGALFSGIRSTIYSGEGKLDFSLNSNVQMDYETGSFEIMGSFRRKPSAFLELTLQSHQFPLQTLAGLFRQRLPPMVTTRLDTAIVSAQVYLTTNFKSISFVAPYLEAVDKNNRDNRITMGLAGNNQSLEVYDLAADWNGYSVEGLFTSTRSDQGELTFETFFYVQGIPYSFDGFYVPKETFILHGDYNTDISVLISKRRTLFRIIGDDLPVPFHKGTSYASFSARGVYVDTEKWEIIADRANLKNFPIPGMEDGEISLSARLTPEKGQIYALEFKDSFSTLAGNGDIALSFPPNSSLSGWVQLDGNNGRSPETNQESYTAMFSLMPQSFNAEVFFTGSPVRRFGDMPIEGNIRGNLDITGPLNDLIYSVNASMTGGRLNNDPFSFQTSLILSGQNISLQSLDIRFLNTNLENGRGEIDLDKGIISYSTTVSGIARKKPLKGNISLELNTSRTEGIESMSDLQELDFAGRIALADLYFGGHKIRDWEIALNRQTGVVNFSGGPENSLYGTFHSGGNFDLTLENPLPITFASTGNIDKGIITMEIDDFYWDFSSLARLELIPYFHISEGIFRGSAVISGPFNDPDFNGVVYGEGVMCGIPLIPDEFGPIEARMILDGKNLTARNLDFAVGAGRAAGDLLLEVDHWIPRAYDIRVHTVGTPGVRLEDTFFGINTSGFGSGEIVIVGDRNGVDINGTITAETTVITLENIGAERKKRTSDYGLNLNLAIGTGSRIEFFWPARVVPILRATAAAGETVALSYNSVKDSFSLIGDIGIQGGQVYYFSRNFYLREGVLSFNENQDKFDPRLTMRAEIYEVDDQGERVKIAMVLDNTPLSQFRPQFESEPLLSNPEIFAILGQDLIIELGGDNIDIAKALVFTGDMVSQFILMRSFEDRIKQLLRLDLFSVRTNMLENIVLEKVLGDETIPLDGGSASFGKYFDNTTIIGGKQIGKNLFLEMMIRLNSKNVYISDLEYFDKLEVESEISIEWESPIALLELTFKPEVTDFVSSLDNTKLALSWRLSY